MVVFRYVAFVIGMALTVPGVAYAQDDQSLQPTAEDSPTMSNPKADCETLMNSFLPFAEQMLDRYGEFYPYGGAMHSDGKITAVAGYQGSERPAPTDIIKILKAAFVAGAKDGKFKATALVYDARVILPGATDKTDAIAVSLDHRQGYSVVVIFPYKIEDGHAAVSAPFARKGEADIFVVN